MNLSDSKTLKIFLNNHQNKGFKTYLIRKLIGSGTEGSVYEYGKNKIIKFSYKKNLHEKFTKTKFEILMKRLQRPSSLYNRVHKFGVFKIKNTNVYWYICSKLNKLSIKEFNINTWEKKANKLNVYGLNYYDWDHNPNIMVDNTGKQKIVDLTSFQLIQKT